MIHNAKTQVLIETLWNVKYTEGELKQRLERF